MSIPCSQVSVRNVFIFPGIPSLMERAFSGLEHLFAGSGTTFHTREVTETDQSFTKCPLFNPVVSQCEEAHQTTMY